MSRLTVEPLNTTALKAIDPKAFAKLNTNQRVFLAAYGGCGIIKRAAVASGINHGNHYIWMKNDETYRAYFNEVHEIVVGLLEDTAFERAVEGLKRYKFTRDGEPIMHPIDKDENGNPVPYFEAECSDLLMNVLLKANKPD
ncbi:MAG: hypothetical protein KDB18_11635, partial [Salinibacterium sp.]|nr:hypothetical protein [Salinibacterium sp.]